MYLHSKYLLISVYERRRTEIFRGIKSFRLTDFGGNYKQGRVFLWLCTGQLDFFV